MHQRGTANGPSPRLDAEALLFQFEKAWRRGPPPRLESYVTPLFPSQGGKADSTRRALLEELVMLDLEYRWKRPTSAGGVGGAIADKPRLEDYLRLYPELGTAVQVSPELLGAEYRVRHRWGDRPPRADYGTRFAGNPALGHGVLTRIEAELKAEFQAKRVPSPPPAPPAAPRPTRAALPELSVSAFVDLLRRYQVLEESPMQELTSRLLREYAQARSLARELLQRGWLTAYQINQIFLGNGQGLLLKPYLLVERLGEGGTGQVFKARHLHMHRTVALKVIRRELLSEPDVVRRFYREIQLLSQLTHPNIVHAYDAGPVGETHFLVMEYVRGIDLAKHVRQVGPLPSAQAIDFIRQAALGLQHLHQAGLVHRDLKPHNLLITRVPELPDTASPLPGNRWGTVKLLDLGLARIELAGEAPAPGSIDRYAGSVTPVGAVLLGTLDYMAPEQALDFHQADIRADIYSLGCTLYFLLSGQSPFSGGTLAQRLLRHQQTEPPPLEELRRDLPPALTPVYRKMLAKRPEERPQTPADVAQALAPLVAVAEEYAKQRRVPLARRPVTTPNGVASRMAAPDRRPIRSAILAAVAAACLLLVGIGGYLLHIGSSSAPPSVPTSPSALPLAKAPDRGIDAEEMPFLPNAPLSGSALVVRPGTVEGVRSWTLETRAPRGTVRELAYSPDGRRLAIAADDNAIRIYATGDVLSLERVLVGHDHGHQPGVPVLLSWSPDSRFLASAGHDDGTVRLWHVDSGRALRMLKIPSPITGLSWSADGRTLACVSRQTAAVLLFDARTGRPLFSLEGHQGGVGGLAWAPDGKTLATGGEDRTIRLWDTASGRTLRTISGGAGYVRRIAWSPDGTRLAATAQGDDQVRVWTTATGQPLATAPQRDPGGIVNLAWTPDSKTLLFCDGGARLWEPGSSHPPRLLPSGIKISTGAWTPDGKMLTVGGAVHGGGRGVLETWDAATNMLVHNLEGHQLWPAGQALVWSPDGRTIAAVDYPFAGVSLWDTATGEWLRTLSGHTNHVMVAAWSPDGGTLATGSLDRDVRLWESGSGALLRRCPGHTDSITALAWAADGRTLASGSADRTARLWDAMSGKNPHILSGHDDAVTVLAWSADNALLASGGGEYDRTVRLWNPATGRSVHEPLAHPRGLSTLAWGMDNKSLAAGMATSDNVLIWDASTGKFVKELQGYQGGAIALEWLPGDVLAATCSDQKIRRWDVQKGQLLRTVALPASGTPAPDRQSAAAFAWPLIRFWTADNIRPSGQLLLLERDQWLALAPDGNFRATPALARELVFVVQTDSGQEMLTATEFSQKFGWKNKDGKRSVDAR